MTTCSNCTACQEHKARIHTCGAHHQADKQNPGASQQSNIPKGKVQNIGKDYSKYLRTGSHRKKTMQQCCPLSSLGHRTHTRIPTILPPPVRISEKTSVATRAGLPWPWRKDRKRTNKWNNDSKHHTHAIWKILLELERDSNSQGKKERNWNESCVTEAGGLSKLVRVWKHSQRSSWRRWRNITANRWSKITKSAPVSLSTCHY